MKSRSNVANSREDHETISKLQRLHKKDRQTWYEIRHCQSHCTTRMVSIHSRTAQVYCQLTSSGAMLYPHSTSKSRLSKSRIPSPRNFMVLAEPTLRRTLRNNGPTTYHNGKLYARKAVTSLQRNEAKADATRKSLQELLQLGFGILLLRPMAQSGKGLVVLESDHCRPQSTSMMPKTKTPRTARVRRHR